MTDDAVTKYERDLRRLQDEVMRADGAAADCRHRLNAFIVHREVHIAYNRAVQEAGWPDHRPGAVRYVPAISRFISD